jgi:thiol-disulfide isomerase/thioredoxin
MSALKKWAAGGVGFALLASLSAAAPSLRASVISDARKPAASFVLTDANGKSIRLNDYKGKVVLLDFWATWCTGCKEEIPWFIEFVQKYKSKGLVAIGVALDDDGWKSVRPYLAQHLIPYTISVADLPFAGRYGVTAAMPDTVLIDRRGRIADFHEGKVDKDAWEREIRDLLAEK